MQIVSMKRRLPAVHSFRSSRPAVWSISSLALFTCLTLPWITLFDDLNIVTVSSDRKSQSRTTRRKYSDNDDTQQQSWPLTTNFHLDTTNNESNDNNTSSTSSPTSAANAIPVASALVPPTLLGKHQNLTEPWDIVDQYIEWHSKEAIRQDPYHRSYALSFYSCPLQAGNRWHHFMNSFLWSILTNRTMLWQYWDRETCKVYGKHYDSRICSAANKLKGCDPYLRRESWMTSHEKWKRQNPILKKAVKIKKLSYWATHSPNSKPGRGFQPYQNSSKEVKLQLGMDARPDHYPMVVFPQMLGQTSNVLYYDETVRNHLLHTEWARQTAQVLYKYGPDLLYGLLFHSAFSFTPQLIQNTTSLITPNPNYKVIKPSASQSSTTNDTLLDDAKVSATCSIAVHSRHTNSSLLGRDISQEVKCIESLWQQHTTNSTVNAKTIDNACDLYVMTDRPYTLNRLVEWCSSYNPTSNLTTFPCRRVIFASHQQGVSFIPEHGPYAGVGFLQDLAVVQQSAYSSIGIVGGHQRSSTDLLTEWMEYERLLEYYTEDEEDEDDTSNSTGAPRRRRRLSADGDTSSSSQSSLVTRPIPEIPRCILPGSSRRKHGHG